MRRTRLKQARLAQGLTAIALSELTGIREEKVFAVERGRYMARREEAVTWAAALHMKPEEAFPELFGEGCER